MQTLVKTDYIGEDNKIKRAKHQLPGGGVKIQTMKVVAESEKDDFSCFLVERRMS